jgi:hypothetical protein
MALVHGDPPGLTEIGNLHVTQLDLEAFGSGFATGEEADVMQHTLALIAEARRPNGGNLQVATQLFHNESGKRFSGDVLCDYQHRPPTFCNLLQQWEQIFSGADWSFVDEDIDVVERNFHPFGVSNKWGERYPLSNCILQIGGLSAVMLGMMLPLRITPASSA